MRESINEISNRNYLKRSQIVSLSIKRYILTGLRQNFLGNLPQFDKKIIYFENLSTLIKVTFLDFKNL